MLSFDGKPTWETAHDIETSKISRIFTKSGDFRDIRENFDQKNIFLNDMFSWL